MNKRSIRDLPDDLVRGRRALVRVDFNVPLDDAGKVTDDTRIRSALPTIDLLISRGAQVVLLSHFGRPKGRPNPKYSLEPVANHLRGLTRHSVTFVPATDSDAAVDATRRLAAGGILLLENTRFLPGEEANDPALARALARLGDFFVNDAFGAAHRAHASTAGITDVLRPAVAGLLMENELRYLGGALETPERPFTVVLGGAKVSGKIDVIESLLPKADTLLIGGAMACTFFRSLGMETGKSLVEPDKVDLARDLLRRADKKIVLPIDVVIAKSLEDKDGARAVHRNTVPADHAIYDVGPATTGALGGSFGEVIAASRTVVWNGPMGVFETPPFDAGTRAIAQLLVAATEKGATTIVGGGDSVAALTEAGLADRVSHVSTGGGASLEFLEGKTLPGVAALDDAVPS